MENPFIIDRSVDPAARSTRMRNAVVIYMLKGGAAALVLVSAVVIFIYALKFVATFLPEDPYAQAPLAPPVQVAAAPVACFSGCSTQLPVHTVDAGAGGCTACHSEKLAVIPAPKAG